MTNPPPTPRSLQSPPSLNTLRTLMARERVARESTFNVAKSLLKPETKIIFKRNGREAVARVISVEGVPGRVRVHVEKLITLKKIELQLEDITGIVQEN